MRHLKDRVIRAYVLIMITMAVSVGLVAHEQRRADRALALAVRHALVKGVETGCEDLTNPTRQAVQQAISQLEIQSWQLNITPPVNNITGENAYDVSRDSMEPINCEFYARNKARFMFIPTK